MSLTVQNNLIVLSSKVYPTNTSTRGATSINRKSPGPGVDTTYERAAALSAEKTDIAPICKGIRDGNDAIALLQTMDRSASVIHQKLCSLKIRAESTSSTGQQLDVINSDFEEMRKEIEKIADTTDYNGIKMLNTSAATCRKLEILVGNDDGPGTAMTSVFDNFQSGDRLTYVLTTHDGIVKTFSAAVTKDMHLSHLINDLNDMFGNYIVVRWDSGCGILVEDRMPGVSRLDLKLFKNAAKQYDFNVVQEGAEREVTIRFSAGCKGDEESLCLEKYDLTPDGLGIGCGIDISGHIFRALDHAMRLTEMARDHFRDRIGRLQNTVTELSARAEILQGADPLISDFRTASHLSFFTGSQVKARAFQAALVQANTIPQAALRLLGG